MEEARIYASNRPLSYQSTLLLTPRRRFNASKKGKRRWKKKVQDDDPHRMRQRPYSESRVGDFSRISYLFSRRPGRESRPGNRKCRRFKRTRVTCFSHDQGLQGASSPVISSIVSTFLLSLFLSLTFPTLVVFILVRTPPFLFVAQFHLPVSRQLSRENCEKGWGRERGNSLRGILVPTRHYLARETSQLRWWCSHTVGTFGGEEKREREYILHTT